MKSQDLWGKLGWAGFGALALVLAYQTGQARANGAPSVEPLVYSGVLEEATEEGYKLLEGPRNIGVRLLKDATEVCITNGQNVTVTAGRFSLVLDASCAAAVRGEPDLLVEVIVDGAPLPKTKIAAVPYALEADRAKVADQMADPSCPFGYTPIEDGVEGAELVVCEKGGVDQVVRVGKGASAFWIDRYEAGLYTGETIDKAAVLVPNGAAAIQSFPKNGQWLGTSAPYHAESRRGVSPTANITWFQAAAACRASGKRLPNGEEWLAAARGTNDPGESDGTTQGKCNTKGTLRPTGIEAPTPNLSCVSASGAEDMIGNYSEWTVDWFAGVEKDSKAFPWPTAAGDDYRGDAIYGVVAFTITGLGPDSYGNAPSAAVRGGGNTLPDGNEAGTFYMEVTASPSFASPNASFRCVMP